MKQFLFCMILFSFVRFSYGVEWCENNTPSYDSFRLKIRSDGYNTKLIYKENDGRIKELLFLNNLAYDFVKNKLTEARFNNQKLYVGTPSSSGYYWSSNSNLSDCVFLSKECNESLVYLKLFTKEIDFVPGGVFSADKLFYNPSGKKKKFIRLIKDKVFEDKIDFVLSRLRSVGNDEMVWLNITALKDPYVLQNINSALLVIADIEYPQQDVTIYSP